MRVKIRKRKKYATWWHYHQRPTQIQCRPQLPKHLKDISDNHLSVTRTPLSPYAGPAQHTTTIITAKKKQSTTLQCSRRGNKPQLPDAISTLLPTGASHTTPPATKHIKAASYQDTSIANKYNKDMRGKCTPTPARRQPTGRHKQKGKPHAHNADEARSTILHKLTWAILTLF